ncbi:hypothetical protein [Leptolyngbya phage Lbo-JY46]
MNSYRAHISDIVTELKAYNLDNSIPYKFLFHKLQDKAYTFLKMDSEYRKLLKNSSLFLPLNCVELKEVPISECGFSISDLITVKRSCKRLPDQYETSYGEILKVLTLDLSREFTKITPESYKDYKARRFGNKRFFWIYDNYLYIPDTSVEKVYVTGAFKYSNEVEAFNSNTKNCVSYLDAMFNFPDYITSLAKLEVVKELSSVFLQIQKDEKPNLNENEKI